MQITSPVATQDANQDKTPMHSYSPFSSWRTIYSRGGNIFCCHKHKRKLSKHTFIQPAGPTELVTLVYHVTPSAPQVCQFCSLIYIRVKERTIGEQANTRSHKGQRDCQAISWRSRPSRVHTYAFEITLESHLNQPLVQNKIVLFKLQINIHITKSTEEICIALLQ